MKHNYILSPTRGDTSNVTSESVTITGKLWGKLLQASGNMERDVYDRADGKAFAAAVRQHLGESPNQTVTTSRGKVPVFVERPRLKARNGFSEDDICEAKIALAIFDLGRGVAVKAVPAVDNVD